MVGEGFHGDPRAQLRPTTWTSTPPSIWEYLPLGPHQGKSFATSIGPWVVPLAALQAARVPLPGQDPQPLPYLRGTQDWGLDVELAIEWNGERPPYRDMYWSPAQMLAHMTVNGASTRTGDLFASGTISGPERHQRGAFIELTWVVASRSWSRARSGPSCSTATTSPSPRPPPAPNWTRIGFGEVTGGVRPAHSAPPSRTTDGG